MESRSLAKDKKINFAISPVSLLVYDLQYPSTVVTSDFIGGCVKHTFCLRQTGKRISYIRLPDMSAYKDKVPIKLPKMNDIKKVFLYVDHQYSHFYEQILLWPTEIRSNGDEDSN
ncbi:hypothetical protein ANN_19359 [Periplaneta americana]|uniref:Uncharacterized protein n=1 Tax=Periplaneta americana TaxID=6978 RepID=A0ABQ8S9N5_PERAM|nr:hypothetical protein ANN_19359 [Periplaneta americana]